MLNVSKLKILKIILLRNEYKEAKRNDVKKCLYHILLMSKYNCVLELKKIYQGHYYTVDHN